MASPYPLVTSEYTQIKFDVDDKSYCFQAEAACGFVLGLQTSADKASLLFKEVVACRSIIILKSVSNTRHEQSMWYNKGSFTLEQFLEMIKYKAGILNAEWYQHMDDSSRVSVLSS